MADEAQFGVPGCTCRPWTRQNGDARYLDQPGDTVDMISGWEIGRDCPHHKSADEAPQPTAGCSCGVLRAGPGQHLPECPSRDAETPQEV